jgi:hypothetical protein
VQGIFDHGAGYKMKDLGFKIWHVQVSVRTA